MMYWGLSDYVRLSSLLEFTRFPRAANGRTPSLSEEYDVQRRITTPNLPAIEEIQDYEFDTCERTKSVMSCCSTRS